MPMLPGPKIIFRPIHEKSSANSGKSLANIRPQILPANLSNFFFLPSFRSLWPEFRPPGNTGCCPTTHPPTSPFPSLPSHPWARSYRRFMGNKQGLNRDEQEPKQGVGPMLHKILSYRQAGSNIHVNCVDSPLLHGNWEGTMVPVSSLLWRNKQEGSRGPLSISRDWQ